MSGQVDRSPEVRADLLEQHAYIAWDNPAAADRFLLAAERAFQNLANLPHLGQVWPSPDPRLAGLRFWPIPRFEKHLVFYRPTDEGILVVRVLHSARDIPLLLR